MSKRHYTRLADDAFKCVSCRQEFNTREELGRHYGLRGQCKHPISVGLRLDIDASPYRWTTNKPVRLSKAA